MAPCVATDREECAYGCDPYSRATSRWQRNSWDSFYGALLRTAWAPEDKRALFYAPFSSPSLLRAAILVRFTLGWISSIGRVHGRGRIATIDSGA